MHAQSSQKLQKIRAHQPPVLVHLHMACGNTNKIDVHFVPGSPNDPLVGAQPPWKVNQKVDSSPCKYNDKIYNKN